MVQFDEVGNETGAKGQKRKQEFLFSESKIRPPANLTPNPTMSMSPLYCKKKCVLQERATQAQSSIVLKQAKAALICHCL